MSSTDVRITSAFRADAIDCETTGQLCSIYKARSQSVKSAYCEGEDGRHAEEVVVVLSHGENVGDDGLPGPLDTEDLCQSAEVDGGSFSDRIHRVAEPRHTELRKLLIKEANAELLREQRNIVDDGLANAPLLVLSELHDGRQESLREQLDADDIVDLFNLGNDVEADVRELVFEKLKVKRKKVLYGGVFSKKRCEAGDLLGQGGANMLGSVACELSHARQKASEDHFSVDEFGEA